MRDLFNSAAHFAFGYAAFTYGLRVALPFLAYQAVRHRGSLWASAPCLVEFGAGIAFAAATDMIPARRAVGAPGWTD
jgi:hypothetical protein